jgi:glutathione synthase/RimK-type ligase-like ATP-grasp enzyme
MALILDSGFHEVVIKPTISASAYGTYRLQISDRAAISTALSAIPDSSPLLLQEFIPTILTAGELSFIFFNGINSHTLRKRPKAGDFRVQEDFGGSRELITSAPAQIDEATEILRTADGLDWLYARVDVVPFRGRLFLMELEAIDPMLYFDWEKTALNRFAHAIATRV